MVFKSNLVKYCFVSMFRNVYADPYSIYSSIMLEYFLLVKYTEKWGYNHTVLSRVYRKARQHDGCLTDMFHKLQTPNLVEQFRWWNIHRWNIVNREVIMHSVVQATIVKLIKVYRCFVLKNAKFHYYILTRTPLYLLLVL